MKWLLLFVIRDLIRSRWMLFLTFFYALFSGGMYLLSGDIARVVVALIQVVTMLTPLLATILTVMYYYSIRDFLEMVLAMPLNRFSVISAIWLGIGTILSATLLIGAGIPPALTGTFHTELGYILLGGVFLTFIFAGLAMIPAVWTDQRILGFAWALLLWLVFAVLYDGFFLLLMLYLEEYPLERIALAGVLLNPIDLARVWILLHVEISALMGYTGAVLKKFLGSTSGAIVSLASLSGWLLFSWMLVLWRVQQRDF